MIKSPIAMTKKYKTKWDFNVLFKKEKESLINKKRADSIYAANQFVNNWAQKESYLKSPKILKKALDEYQHLIANFGANDHESFYYELKNSLNLDNPEIRARLNISKEITKKIQNDLNFFELRISKIPEKDQKTLLSYQPLSKYSHFLEKLFIHAKYLLSENEEKILNLKGTTSHSNWIRMMSSLLSKEERKVIQENGKKKNVNFSEILSLLSSKDKKVRDSAANAFNDILSKFVDIAENEINSVLENKKINDELRGYKRSDKQRHVLDDIGSQVVDVLVKTISSRFDISKRYYKLKSKLLKVKKLKYHERNVEYGKINVKYSTHNTIKLISEVLREIDIDFHNIFEAFLEEGRVDFLPKKGKRSGAFASLNLITQPSFILLNHTGSLNDVLTFAHELGHGINFEMMRKSQNALNFSTPNSIAEVASTFFEDFVLKKLIHDAKEETKLSIMMAKLNSDVSTIFRQIAFYNFEKELHNKFREKGYLAHNEIGKIFRKHMRSYMGSYVEQSKGSENWWLYIQHFRYFYYVYSYASGLLISKSLQQKLKKHPGFINDIKFFLSSGSCDSPQNIFKNLNIDITKKGFWNKGISEVEKLLDETEKLAKKLGKI